MRYGAFTAADFCQSSGICAVAPAYDDHHIYFPRQLTRCLLSLHRCVTNGFVDVYHGYLLFDGSDQPVSKSNRKRSLYDYVCFLHWRECVYILHRFHHVRMSHRPFSHAFHFRVLLFTDEYNLLSVRNKLPCDFLIAFDVWTGCVH